MIRTQSAFLTRFYTLLTVLMLAALGTTGAFAEKKAPKGDAPKAAKSETTKPTTPVDVNSADEKTLETLPGVGAATAQKIIAGRPYKDEADLAKVKGLGKAKVDAMKGQLLFVPGTKHSGTNAPATTTPKPSKAKPTPAPTATPQPAAGKATPAPKAPVSKLAPGQKININTASEADLDKLPGIGPVKAKAIIDYRAKNGSFKSIEDIKNVKGIKDGEFAKVKDFISV